MPRPFQLAAVVTAVFLAALPSCAQSQQHAFDGKWWLNVNPDERSGFVNGFSDCAVWSANNNSFNATPEQVGDKITERYETHKSSLNQSVIELWKNLPTPMQKTSAGGETWSNPHWYLNVGWWLSEREPSQSGYIEGYLHCSKSLSLSSESYSHSANFYSNQINVYLKTHKTAEKVPVATILQRFRDQKENK